MRSRTWLELEFVLEDIDPSGKKRNKRVDYLRLDEKDADATVIARGADAAREQAEAGSQLPKIMEEFLKASELQDLRMGAIVRESSVATGEGQLTALVEAVLSNTTEIVAEVDYATTYYYNVEAPWLGTGEGTIKLAADGTMTEATAKVDATKLADVITEELPLAEFLADLAGLSLAAVPPSTTDSPKHALSINVARRGYLYTLTKIYDLFGTKDERSRSPLPLNFTDANSVARTVIGAASKKSKTPANTATFQGSLTLPKK